MADEHPLEQLLRDAKERDDVKAAALIAEQRKAFDLQEQVRSQWVRTKAGLLEEIGRANAVLEKHNLPERFALRDLPEAGAGNIARCNLALAYPSKSARAEYDLRTSLGEQQCGRLAYSTACASDCDNFVFCS